MVHTEAKGTVPNAPVTEKRQDIVAREHAFFLVASSLDLITRIPACGSGVPPVETSLNNRLSRVRPLQWLIYMSHLIQTSTMPTHKPKIPPPPQPNRVFFDPFNSSS